MLVLLHDETNRRTGILSLIAGIVIVVVIKKRKEKKKRAKLSALGASREAEDPFATQDSQLGVTTQITANPRQSSTRSSVSGSSGPSPGDDPFLTESEKAILTRVASRDGEANANVDLNVSKLPHPLVVWCTDNFKAKQFGGVTARVL
jgi:hypothetical protein